MGNSTRHRKQRRFYLKLEWLACAPLILRFGPLFDRSALSLATYRLLHCLAFWISTTSRVISLQDMATQDP